MKQYITPLLASLVAVFTPVLPTLLTVGFLIALDFIVGIYRAFKLGEEITSRKMGNTISKMLLYNITILSLWVFEKYILQDAIPITKIGAALISITELKSIDESVEKLTGLGIWKKLVRIVKRGESETKDFL
jgi:fumarate reductase subunit D